MPLHIFSAQCVVTGNRSLGEIRHGKVWRLSAHGNFDKAGIGLTHWPGPVWVTNKGKVYDTGSKPLSTPPLEFIIAGIDTTCCYIFNHVQLMFFCAVLTVMFWRMRIAAQSTCLTHGVSDFLFVNINSFQFAAIFLFKVVVSFASVYVCYFKIIYDLI